MRFFLFFAGGAYDVAEALITTPGRMVEAAIGDEVAPEGSYTYLDENENGGSGRTLRDMSPATARREFELAVQFAMPAIEEAACLERRDGRQTRTNSHGELSLSFDDWFKLRGLLLCARFGACEEKWPPGYDYRALQHWQAWKAQGHLAPSEARQRFIEAVERLPGYRDGGGRDASNLARWIIICPCAWPMRLNLCGLIAIRFEKPPPRTPTLEEAEASRRRALLRRPKKRGPPGTLESFVGKWRHVRTDGMEEYLRTFGVGLIRRRAARVRHAHAHNSASLSLCLPPL